MTARLPLLLLACALVGCGDNQTIPDRSPFVAGEPAPLECVPNLDGMIDATELQTAIGVPVRFLVTPEGTTREIDQVGTPGDDGTLTWDFATDYADDQLFTLRPQTLEDRWYASQFPADAFRTPFDPAARLDTIGRNTPDGLELLGLASAEENPAEGQTLLIYTPPIVALQYPVVPGDGYVSQGDVVDGTLRGLPYAGTDTYEVAVAASGSLDLPQIGFDQVMQVQTRVTVSPSVGEPTTQRQTSYFFECFAEVARAVSLPGEPNANFTTAAQLWRLGFQ